MTADPIVIIGASHAGVQMAASVREAGCEREIILIGEEPASPYQRPPLSKGLLAGKVAESDIRLRGSAWYAKNRIVHLAGRRAVGIDRYRRRVILRCGEEVAYSRLGLATGSRARRLSVPGAELKRVAYLRDLADAEAIREQLSNTESAVVIGGGFIGLEVAATLCQMGKRITVVEGRDRLMARAVSPVVSEWFAGRHADEGVKLHFSTHVEAILDDGQGYAAGVRLAGGGDIRADLVIVGVGVVPAIELANSAQLNCGNGIVVDSLTRTSDPLIAAAGDVTEHPSIFSGALLRLESVQNATDQAKVAGQVLAGLEPAPYDAVPWFWSVQHATLQIVGLARGVNRSVVRGDPASGKFSVYSFADERLICIESIDCPRDHVAGRKLMAKADYALTAGQAADPDCDLLALALHAD